QQPFEVVAHRPNVRLLGLDPTRDHICVEWLAPEEVAIEVDCMGIQPDPEHSPARHVRSLRQLLGSPFLKRYKTQPSTNNMSLIRALLTRVAVALVAEARFRWDLRNLIVQLLLNQ